MKTVSSLIVYCVEGLAYATKLPSSNTLASKKTLLSFDVIALVERVAIGGSQLCKEIRNGEPCLRPGTKHATVGTCRETA